MTAEECWRLANRCLEWAAQARHAEIRNVYFEMADRWTREAEQAEASEPDEDLSSRLTVRSSARPPLRN